MDKGELTAHIRNLIAANEMQKALEQLRIFFDNSPILKEIIQQWGRYDSIKQQLRMGIASLEDARMEENKIRVGLLELLDHIEQGKDSKHLEEELKEVAEKHKTIIQNAEKIYNIDHIDNANFS